MVLVRFEANGQYVDAGADDTICTPGAAVMLNGSRDPSTYFYYNRWTPSESLSNDTVLRPVATPFATTTYYLSCFYESNLNLVSNGDFENGNSGFGSQYIYGGTTPNALWDEGKYSVVTSASHVHSNFPLLYDHTYGNGNGKYMAVNGAGTANTVVWEQTVSHIQPHTDYIFYTWVLTIIGNTVDEIAKLQFSINSNLLGQVFQAPFPASSGWQQFYTVWNSGVNTSAVIRIINQNTVTSGNDFGLDDIYFAPVVPATDSVTIYVSGPTYSEEEVTICADDTFYFGGALLTQPGLYYDTLSNAFGCDSIVHLTLHKREALPVDLGPERTICREDNAYIRLNPGHFASYLWNDGSGNATLEVNRSGTYSVTVTDENGCSGSGSVRIEFTDLPEVMIENANNDFCETYETELWAVTDAVSVEWNTGEQEKIIRVNRPGMYTVTAMNGNCKNSSSYTIEECEFNLFLPNAITPGNRDGVNDFFFVPFLPGAKSFEIYIYDRYGGLVFYSDRPDFKWNGTCKGKLFSSAVYSYIISITPLSGKKNVFKGFITVI